MRATIHVDGKLRSQQTQFKSVITDVENAPTNGLRLVIFN